MNLRTNPKDTTRKANRRHLCLTGIFLLLTALICITPVAAANYNAEIGQDISALHLPEGKWIHTNTTTGIWFNLTTEGDAVFVPPTYYEISGTNYTKWIIPEGNYTCQNHTLHVTTPQNKLIVLSAPKRLSASGAYAPISIAYYDAQKQYNTTAQLNWTSDNESVLTILYSVSIGALIQSQTAGLATIHVSLETDPLVNITIPVTVEKQILSSIYLPVDDYYNTINYDIARFICVCDQFGNEIDDPNEQILVTTSNKSVIYLRSETEEEEQDAVITTSGGYLNWIVNTYGETTITATSLTNTSASVSKTVRVYKPIPARLFIKPALTYMEDFPEIITNRSSHSIDVEMYDTFGEEIAYPEDLVEWTVSDPSVLTFELPFLAEYHPNERDLIINESAVGKNITIRASLIANTSIYAEVNTSIIESIPTSLSIWPDEDEITIVADLDPIWVESISATVRDQFSEEINETILWETDRPDVINITVDTTSPYHSIISIIGKTEGCANITATVPSNSSLMESRLVTVEKPILTDIYLDASESIPRTDTGYLTIIGVNQQDFPMNLPNYQIIIGDTSILTVKKTAKPDPREKAESYTIIPHAAGTTDITVICEGIEEMCTVTVEKGEEPTPVHKSSRSNGASILLTATSVATPTQLPVVTPTATATPTVPQTAQPTQIEHHPTATPQTTPSATKTPATTPAPFAAILAGLGVVALLLRRK